VTRPRGALLALLLGAGAAALPARARAQTAAAPAAAAPPTDDWFGHDKALHFGASALIASGGYAGTALVTDDGRLRLLGGAALGLGAGAGKELWDLAGHGDASWRDFTWDVVGTATGLAVAAAIDWAIARLSR
jgi:putative lipoprotein